jgi:hypothetical protein
MYLGQTSFIGLTFSGELKLSFLNDPKKSIELAKDNQLDQIKDYVLFSEEDSIFKLDSRTSFTRKRVFFDKHLKVTMLGIVETGYEFFITTQIKYTLPNDQAGNLDIGKLNSLLMRRYGIWEHIRKTEVDNLPLLADVVNFKNHP